MTDVSVVVRAKKTLASGLSDPHNPFVRIGPYETVSEIGRGGTGVVLRARSPSGEDVAIKVLLRLDAETVARFDRERRLVGAFTAAEGFVPLLDAGTCEHGPYLVMPFMKGGTLRTRLRHGALDLDDTLAFAEALAAALARAHERGIVHRDLKPENVLFTEDGDPLVADLGLAKHFDRSAPGASQSVSTSVEGAVHGTAGYMAPEQMHDSSSIGPEADVFALGAILYECLAGRPAFEAHDLVELLAKVAKGRVEPLRAARPDAPSGLVRIIERALAPDPAKRFADAGALLAALRAPAPRGRGPFVVAACVVAVLAVGALALAPRGERPAPSPPPPSPPAVPASQPGPPAPPSAPPPAPRSAPPSAPPGLPPSAPYVAPSDLHERVVKLVQRSATKVNRGDFDGAIADATAAIELDPWHARAWCNRGATKANKGDFDGAIVDATKAIELDPTMSSAWANRAWARAWKADIDGAIGDSTIAIELAPDLSSAWATLGFSKGQKGDLEGSIAACDKAIELDATKAAPFGYRGEAKAALGDHRGAIADFTQQIELEPQGLRGWSNRASAKEALGDLDGAIADNEQALKLASNDATAARLKALIAKLKTKRSR